MSAPPKKYSKVRDFLDNLGNEKIKICRNCNAVFRYTNESTTLCLSCDFEEEISTLLKNYEPRIELNSVYVVADEDSNALNVQIDYNIVGLPIPSQSIEFLLQPTRV